jgi:hypothetical protein
MPEITLERLVWRYEYKFLAAERLAELLREEAQQLGDEFELYLKQRAVLRQWNRDLINEFEQARSQAYRLLDSRDYHAALRQLRLARRSLETMTLLLQAHTDTTAAAAEAAQLAILAHTEELRQLPTLKSVAQMIELAEQFLRDKQYRQASFAARFCLRQTRLLQAREDGDTERKQQLTQRIEEIAALYTGTRHLASAPDPNADGMLEENVTALLAEGFVSLVESLTIDLTTMLAPRRRFYREYQRVGADASPAGRAAIADLAKRNLWDAATWQLRQTALAAVAEELALLQTRILNVAAQIAPPAAEADLRQVVEQQDSEVRDGQSDDAAESG